MQDEDKKSELHIDVALTNAQDEKQGYASTSWRGIVLSLPAIPTRNEKRAVVCKLIGYIYLHMVTVLFAVWCAVIGTYYIAHQPCGVGLALWPVVVGYGKLLLELAWHIPNNIFAPKLVLSTQQVANETRRVLAFVVPVAEFLFHSLLVVYGAFVLIIERSEHCDTGLYSFVTFAFVFHVCAFAVMTMAQICFQ